MLEQEFLDSLSQAGIPPTSPLVLDGKLRRYNVYGDKKGRRNGWYRFVRVRDDFAWGVFGCNKRGISEKWSNREKLQLTSYDKKIIRKKQDDLKKEQEEIQGRVALKANAIWSRLRTPDNHPYAACKGVGIHGLREMHNSLVVPLSIDNYIVSLQFINSEGDKRFLTEGQKKGASFLIGEVGPGKNIYISEGYATGASIYDALGYSLCAVLIAFDAYNILPVAEAARTRYPTSKIIIAGDNDQWTAGNPGVSKAQEAADKIGATMIYPQFDYEDKTRPTDWNDFARKNGARALADALLDRKPETPQLPAVTDDRKWRLSLLEGKEERIGYPKFNPKSKLNTYLFLMNHEDFANGIVYNSFTDEVLMIKCPPWHDASKFMPRRLRDTDAAMYVAHLELLGIQTSKEVVHDFLQEIAERNVINPPRDFFESMRWDSRPRLDTWLTYYLGAEKQPREYLAIVGSKWLIGAVSRIYEPGKKFDHVLILEGEQGLQKTTAFKVLSTFHSEAYFLEFSGDVALKDSLMQMQGKLIVEMAELASMLKKNSLQEEMKAFITREVDEYRRPYGKSMAKRPRMFVLGATTNNTNMDEYLYDPTGGRRYLPVGCEHIDLDALREDAPQLWAEAVHRYKAGERTWLDKDEAQLAGVQQKERKSQEALLPRVERALEIIVGESGDITVDKLLDRMGFPIHTINNQVKRTVKLCLDDIGYRETKKDEENRYRVWKKR